ncbi:phosphatidylinositol 4-phosphate 3-kinase C2 domain-containing subunit alpha-like [Polyodon spathula]|uniref:phosphatidylinositol 4-phosphate 3-kinase C2 domain-containing subunit alpha-like n=1 Tax=Polyodon spathula TaxID=7913 RepID=UPI001B7EAA11|nr:phosphatidylinositol 4-phosphate 3-kinase C2 domain-containing subunit alpha-like [Polyodon spathula]
MSQISSSNGFKQNVSPALETSGAQDVGKEEALQMETEALAKLQRDKKTAFNLETVSCNGANQVALSSNNPERDLIVFPESDARKRSERDAFKDIDVEKLTNAELEKLLLDDNFGANNKAPRPATLPGTPVLTSSFPGHLYSQIPFHGGQWNPRLTGSAISAVPRPVIQTLLYPAVAFPKQSCPFQNGFNLRMPSYRAPKPVYLSAQPRYMPFPLQPSALLHSTALMPVYQQPVTPELAKLFAKIASTSEYLKNGKSTSTDLESAITKAMIPILQNKENTNMSKFEWLDLDPLSKPKLDSTKVAQYTDGALNESNIAGDPWDAVLQDESTPESSLPPGECGRSASFHPNGKSAAGTSVTRSQSLNIHSTSALSPKTPGQSTETDKGTRSSPTACNVLQDLEAHNEEVEAFCEEITKLKLTFPHDDLSTNPGYVLSPVMLQRDMNGENASIKVSIEIEGSQQPVTFTCDVSSPVELLIMQALCWVHDDLNQVDIGSYILKVCGQEEVLQNYLCMYLFKHCLGSHEYIQNCRKWEIEIKLQLLSQSTVCRDLARVVEDDAMPVDLEKYLYQVEKPLKETINRQSLNDFLDSYHNQVQLYLQHENNQYKTVDNIVQAVKNICSALDGVETKAITEAVKKLKRTVSLPRSKTMELGSKSADGSNKGATVGSSAPLSPVEESMNGLTTALCDLLQLYLRSFSSSSSPQSALSAPKERRRTKEACKTTKHLQFTLFAAHGIPPGWISSFEKYYLLYSLTHNGKNLFKPVQSKKVGAYKNLFFHIKWDELVSFPIPISQLPLESMLSLTLCGVLHQNASSSPDSNKQRNGPELLGKVSMPLFDFRRVLTRGTKLLGLWTSFLVSPVGTVSRKGNQMERIVMQVNFPNTDVDIQFVEPQPASRPPQPNWETLDVDAQKQLRTLFSKESTLGFSKADKEFLWDKRHYCQSHEKSLPMVLASAPSWDWTSLPEIHSLLNQWTPLSPVCALELLHSKYADSEVRSVAVTWIEHLSDDELADYLPQLVQALKFECYLHNALVMLLLSRALGNIHIAHYLYWLLKDAVQDLNYRRRYSIVLGALLSLCGKGQREELAKQTRLVQLLAIVAKRVRQASGSARQIVLQEGMEKVQSFFLNNNCRLPLNPSLVAKELNVKACSFFNSNAVPLKITLVNADPLGEEINVMFKVGEDLRQDMLALQLIKIMDKLWVQEGLDLRIVNFKCISTGRDRGMVELVPASDTLRKIQVEYGVTGSFKDKPLADWLRKYNPAEEEYEKASENFIYSCAGCCVATYILGICDRHNDNIMLRSTGHMFHIDFGKFLGHAQMFGSFKRDRAPFVLTSDMAYVINGGERPTRRFQLFVDLCCQAYNLIRKHTNLFLNLLSLMTSSGLPELTSAQDLKYVYDALQPQTTDSEATIFFTRLIESSLGSVATKFNFFIHNLAQLRFSGLPSNDEPILLFSPKTYSMKQEGRIKDVSVFTYQKRYNPDKHYTYVVRVWREGHNNTSFIFRTFDEFQELHNKLSILFPLWKLPGFPSKMVLGRTHIKDVAAKRKVELNSYIQNLLSSSTEVAECDMVYTFFHPIARDDKAEGFEGISKSPDVRPMSPTSGTVVGEVKLSVSYRNNTLFIMVMHIKDLVTDDGTDPNPYVKTYLLPDPHKTSKHKTKTSRKTRNPTFNEMLVYSGVSKDSLKQRALQLSVLSAESLRENYFLGGVTLTLKDFDMSTETVNWYKLQAVPYF